MATSMKQIVGEAIVEAYQEVNEELTEFLRENVPGVEPLWWVRNDEKGATLAVRIVPIVGDVVNGALKKDYILALTRDEIVVVKLKTGMIKKPLRKSRVKEVARYPVAQVQDIKAKRGVFTSSMRIRLKSGRTLKFNDMLKSTPFRFMEIYEEIKPS